jgi:hypothetical protein
MTFPAGIITTSEAPGGIPRDQLAPVSHAPEDTAILFALSVPELKRMNRTLIFMSTLNFLYIDTGIHVITYSVTYRASLSPDYSSLIFS